MARRILLVLIGLAALGLALAWPRLNDVETGRTPDYPDLKPREYSSGVPQVTRSAQKAMTGLGWEFLGSGAGPKGAELRAIHTTPLLHIKEEVTVRMSSVGGRTLVSVRSQSDSLPWDFGQNARNIRALLQAMEATP
jgi:hypothetical protein